MQVTAILTRAEEGGFVACNPETVTTSQGETIGEAIANLREAVELYLEEFPKKFGAVSFGTTFDVIAHA
jgi:predicted RNase H-like HicB family nuclease